ncbi:MAG: DUF790 family protein [Magnetococcales bacterium]|nr:DUF790 family protein [Magnetococcales bacterium]
MLTKELLRFNRLRDGRILPRFIDTKNRGYLDLAGEMIAIYTQANGLSHEEIAELVQPVINASRSPLIARGLNKLLLDRCEFREPDPKLEEIRLTAFMESTRQLTAPTVGRLETFRDNVAWALGHTAQSLTATLFSDLAHRQTLEQFRPMSQERLLQRYNMALVQGLLLGATRLELELIDTDTGRLRQFFRQLRFFRLLSTIQQKAIGHYHLVLDGPLSLFDQVRRYGLQFASVLPAICHLQQWKITAQVRPKGGETGQLTLDQGSGLVSHYAIGSVHVPSEFERFASRFEEEVTDWTLLPDTQLLHLEGSDIIVVDFTFRHRQNRVVHLEMFHRWHRAPLLRRLQQLDRQDATDDVPNLVIAVDRHLAKDQPLAEQLANSPYFQAHGFLYNEFPPIKRAVKSLESFIP